MLDLLRLVVGVCGLLSVGWCFGCGFLGLWWVVVFVLLVGCYSGFYFVYLWFLIVLVCLGVGLVDVVFWLPDLVFW